jgi:hypothetical protein
MVPLIGRPLVRRKLWVIWRQQQSGYQLLLLVEESLTYEVDELVVMFI